MHWRPLVVCAILLAPLPAPAAAQESSGVEPAADAKVGKELRLRVDGQPIPEGFVDDDDETEAAEEYGE